MRTITTEELKEANRKALAEGTLAALAPQPDCRYRLSRNRKVYRCAIGCAMTEEELKKIAAKDQSMPVGHALLPIEFEDRVFARDLQDAHDLWCQGYGPSDYRAMLA